MAEKQKNTRPASKVIDVSQPGKAAPSASSRPVIVGNKSIIQDPMMSSSQPATKPTEPAVAVKRTSPQVIAPLSEAEKPTEEVVETAPGQAPNDTKSIEETVQNQSEQTDEKQPAEPSTDATANSSRDASSESSENSKDKSSSIVDAVVDQVSKDKDKKSDEKQEELNKRQAELDKLIEEKKYFVHTSQATKRQRKARGVSLLVLLLLLIGAYLIIDAQLIKNNIKLPYEFFKEAEQLDATTAAQINKDIAKNSNPPQANEYKVPKGYTIYENKELGFKFTYPKEWGEISRRPDTNQVEILESDEPQKQYGPGINGRFSIFTYSSVSHEIVGRKYGPNVQLINGEWKVTKANELDVTGNKVGDVYRDFEGKTPRSQNNDELIVYVFKSGDEGVESVRLIFIANDKLHELYLPSFSDGLYGNVEGTAAENDKTKYNELTQNVIDSVHFSTRS